MNEPISEETLTRDDLLCEILKRQDCYRFKLKENRAEHNDFDELNDEQLREEVL